MFRRAKVLINFSSLVLALLFSAPNSICFAEEIFLSSNKLVPTFLVPGNPMAEIPFDIDTSPFFLVDVVSRSDLFEVTLANPQNQVITADNVADFNGEYSSHELQTPYSFPIGSPTLLVGFHYTYHIRSPLSGNWKITITGNNLPADGEIALASIMAQNSLQVGLLTNEIQYIVNSPVLIMTTIFDGANPVSGASVVATILNLSNDAMESVTLKDDGNEADNLAGDGLYSGGYIPTEPSDYSIMVEINGVTSGGISFNKELFSSFSVRSPLADFNDSFDDQGVDTNGNGLFEHISLNLGVDVDTAGTYKISATLKGSNDIVKTVSSIQDLSQGTDQSIEVIFLKEDIFEIGVDGPYSVTEAFIELREDDGWHLADRTDNQWQTQAYLLSDFEKAEIHFTGNGTDEGVDNDGNNLFDLLNIALEFEIAKLGYYNWSASLMDNDNNEIEFISSSGQLVVGINLLELSFNGQMIGEHGVDGPFYVRNLLIWGEGLSFSKSGVVYVTKGYLSTEFEGGPFLIPLSSNWNLISLPRQPSSGNISDVLSSIAGKYSHIWAYIDNSWRMYNPANLSFSDLTEIEAGWGLWIKMSVAGTLIVSGVKPEQYISLKDGWNLVGYNSTTAQPVADAVASINGKYEFIWAFIDGVWLVNVPDEPGASTLTIMEPGYGYWIKAKEECIWTIDNSQTVFLDSKIKSLEQKFNNRRQQLDIVKKRGIELPPMPPGLSSTKFK